MNCVLRNVINFRYNLLLKIIIVINYAFVFKYLPKFLKDSKLGLHFFNITLLAQDFYKKTILLLD